jgi:hypothetical protein
MHGIHAAKAVLITRPAAALSKHEGSESTSCHRA